VGRDRKNLLFARRDPAVHSGFRYVDGRFGKTAKVVCRELLQPAGDSTPRPLRLFWATSALCKALPTLETSFQLDDTTYYTPSEDIRVVVETREPVEYFAPDGKKIGTFRFGRWSFPRTTFARR
jgi:hypothetical protein